MNTLTARIFAIKRYALHDGPNIRTTIFFKGCPLACQWCHNPEGIDFASKVVFLAEKCVGCGDCVQCCPEKALQLNNKGIYRDNEKCTSCAACVQACPALAHEAIGKIMSVAEIVAEIKKELPFIEQSGGGITCSGGEPLRQPESLLALLEACGKLGIHRAVDTSGFAPTQILLKVACHTDLFLYDLKHMDSIVHERFTGVGNELILKNLQMLSNNGHTIRVRIPLIRAVNDDDKNIRATGAFIARCKGVQGIDLLPCHPFATAKYRKLGLDYAGVKFKAPNREQISRVLEILKQYIADVNIGG
ncbi:MAG: glycyl-radical enzyme activating protein [Pseudomonadota bacterium]